jgi:hypothetical protein
MINIYKCKVIKQMDYLKIGDIKSFFVYDYERLKDKLELIKIEVLK